MHVVSVTVCTMCDVMLYRIDNYLCVCVCVCVCDVHDVRDVLYYRFLVFKQNTYSSAL